MSTVALPIAKSDAAAPAAWLFGLCAAGVAASALVLAGWFPLGFSIVTVFLFAGPHNWLEGRYFVGRMPARWGALRTYYLAGIAGVLALAGAFALLPLWSDRFAWDYETWAVAVAVWNTALVGWIWTLAQMRRRQNPRRAWAGLTPGALALIGVAWLKPAAWDLSLVYLHPLVALTFLDRELAIHRPQWQAVYRRLLCLLPLALAGLWWHLADAPPLPGDDALTARITAHAGADILSGVSSHLLVATHSFLEMLHYGVWLVAIPLVSVRTMPWRIATVPLARRSKAWRMAIAGLLAIGALAVIGFWAGFLADYPRTRDVYFTVAMLHVLAEVPFLLRLL